MAALFLRPHFRTTKAGDFSGTVSADQSVGAIGQYVWSSAQMVADVQSWLDNPSTNFGWLVKGMSPPSGISPGVERNGGIARGVRPRDRRVRRT